VIAKGYALKRALAFLPIHAYDFATRIGSGQFGERVFLGSSEASKARPSGGAALLNNFSIESLGFSSAEASLPRKARDNRSLLKPTPASFSFLL
jgi:hypothetical protein